jgi:phage terminase Nu1 subunit (DNA packaging protein)
MTATPGVNATTVARVCNISTSRVHALQQQPGWPEKIGPAAFDLQKFTLAYIRFIQQELKRRGPSGGPETADILVQRARLLKAQVEQVEKRNAIDRGEFLSASSVMATWTRGLMICRARMLALPQKMAPLLANKQPGYIAEELKIEIYRALTELATGGAVESAGEGAVVSGDDDQGEAPGAAEESDDFA